MARRSAPGDLRVAMALIRRPLTSHELEVSRRDAGDTLFEVLVAMTIMAITAVAVLTSFASAIGASAEETHLSQIYTILKSYAEVATAEIQEDSPALFTTTCPASTYYTSNLTALPAVPTDYAVKISSVTYWNGSAYVSTCTAGSTNSQLITITATYTLNSKVVSTESLSFGVSDFTYVSPPEIAPVFDDTSTEASPYTYTVAVGSAFTYSVIMLDGSPAPAISSTSLPTGVTFVDNGDGTATLSGTTSVAAGSYEFTITADNDVSPNATLYFDLIVASAPVFTSLSAVSFAAGSKVNFTISATDIDSQDPAISPDPDVFPGALKNLTFVDNGNGTATLSGTLESGISGVSYTITVEADNSQQVDSTQSLTITIPTAPIFTSTSTFALAAGTTTTVSKTISATDTDIESPILTMTSALTGALANFTFVSSGNGSGTFSGILVNTDPGTYTVTFQAENSASQMTTQILTVQVIAAPVFVGSTFSAGSGASKVTFTGTSTDATDATYPTVTWSATSTQLKNLVFAKSGTGTTTTWTLTGPLISGNGEYTGTLTATNSLGVQTTQVVTVYTPTSPVFTSGTTVTLTGRSGTYVNNVVVATATDTDDANGEPIFPTADFPNISGDSAIASLTFTDNTNGSLLISGILSGSSGTYYVTITAQNSANTITTETVKISVT
jgi:large repetitive protein